MCGRYAVGNCISNYKKSFQHYVEYYEGCTIEEADETDEDEEIENQTENVELEMIDMRSLLAIRIYYAAKYGLKSVKKSSDYVLMCFGCPNGSNRLSKKIRARAFNT